MSKASLFHFLVQPGEVVRGVRRLGGKGAVLHGIRRTGAAMERALLGPAQLRINPMGAVCNHTCPMCWLQQLDPDEKKRQFQVDREQGLRLADYEAMLESMPPGLTEVNVVGGGEPLVHPECVEIMRAIKRRGLRGYLISNGTLLKEPVARAMVDMRWDLTRISTHAGDAETYAAVQGVDHFERLRENLKTFDRLRREAGVEAGCALHVHHVLQRQNLGTFARMFAFSEDVGADYVKFEIVFALSPAQQLDADELAAAAAELAACAATARVDSNAAEIVASLERESAAFRTAEPTRPAPPAPTAPTALTAEPAAPELPADQVVDPEPAHPIVPVPDAPYRPANRCSVGFDSAFVTAQGEVMPCCFSDESMGNVRDQTFREVWYGARYRDFRKRLINGEFADYCSSVRCKLRSFLHD